MEILNVPVSYRNLRSKPKTSRLQLIRNAELSLSKGTALPPAKGFVNDWVKVTNWVPPVNDAEGH